MADRPANVLRSVAGALAVLSGLSQIAALWLRELTGLAVIDAVVGAIYLLLALGLFGRSRFSLFMGIVVPASAIAWFTWLRSDPGTFHQQRLAADAMIVLLCLIALWRVRKIPTP